MLFYILFISILGLLIMKIDKCKATSHRYRISEKTIFLIAVLGGSLGVWMGMYLFHHKTRHWYFVFGIPCIFVIQIILVYVLFRTYSFAILSFIA